MWEKKYFKPKSLTWWSGFLLSFGLAVLGFVSGVGSDVGLPFWMVSVAQFLIADADPHQLLMTFLVGTGIIGARGRM